MKAWMLYGINDLRYEDTSIDPIKEDEVRIRVRAAGICGSDIPRIYETGAHRMPLIVGHEFSGVVDAVGREDDSKWLGARVGVFPLIPCRMCKPCRQGHFELCRNYDYIGSRRNGAFAEYVSVPADNLIRLPEEVSFEEAAMLEPMAVAVHAMRKGTREFLLSKEEPVAVCGLGTIGLLLAAFLIEAGYENLYVIGNKDMQREKASALGIDAAHYCDSRSVNVGKWLCDRTDGVAVYFECVGKNECITYGIHAAAPMGTVVCVGNPGTDMTFEKDTYWRILRNQLTVTGSWNSSFQRDMSDDWHYVMKRLSEHKIAPTVLISHRLELAELDKGLAVMRDKTEDYCKIMV